MLYDEEMPEGVLEKSHEINVNKGNEIVKAYAEQREDGQSAEHTMFSALHAAATSSMGTNTAVLMKVLPPQEAALVAFDATLMAGVMFGAKYPKLAEALIHWIKDGHTEVDSFSKDASDVLRVVYSMGNDVVEVTETATEGILNHEIDTYLGDKMRELLDLVKTEVPASFASAWR